MKFALWLTALLMIVPQFVKGAPERMTSDKNASSATETSEELKRKPASTQKESPLLPCAGEAHRDKLGDMARLESTTRDCPAEGAIKAQPIRPADPAEPGRPLRYQ
ncbi:hypothetical protein [Bdellovibrio bacteriovorus]|uniref:Uncharacterized protein n=1 Tax=Bdellovibrio bacteriovorus str. Tiberius TaxID=1069642 RepID=K7YP62_BDEBC|nr:hypothetical protein [Bdellovibrio bacteriovorus]AFY01621.1 hypothetical protein Bdt_1934 [Bdellovibrio bacteriovorus str. Tiberius]